MSWFGWGREENTVTYGKYVAYSSYDPGMFLACSQEKIVVNGGEGGSFLALDAASLEKIGYISGHEKRVKSVSFSRCGRRLVSCSSDTIRVWDLTCMKEILRVGSVGEIDFACFHIDDKRLILIESGSLYVYENGKKRIIAGSPKIRRAKISPSGNILGYGCGAVAMWDAEKEVKIWETPLAASFVSFSSKGENVAIASQKDIQITVLDTSTGGKNKTLSPSRETRGLFFLDDKLISLNHNRLKVWDCHSGIDRDTVSIAGEYLVVSPLPTSSGVIVAGIRYSHHGSGRFPPPISKYFVKLLSTKEVFNVD